jgi:hypothetical protein
MKTAMQQAIEYLKSFNLESSAIILEDKFLEKEREQMINFGYECRDLKSILPQDRFEAIYNQDKLLKNYINGIEVDPIKSQVTTTGVWTPKTN